MYCEQCDEKMSEIYNAADDFRLKGWYCERCKVFEPTIGREKKFTKETYENGHKA